MFFKVRNKFLGLKTALDPEEAMYNCSIKEDDVLICNRLMTNEKQTEDETTE